MKKTSLILIATLASMGIWLLFKFGQTIVAGVVLSAPSVPVARQEVQVESAKMDGLSGIGAKPSFVIVSSSDEAWIVDRSASIEISQAVDPVTDEPLGTVKLGGATGVLDETPPFYRFQLKTAKNPILLGVKDTRHHFVRHVTSVHVKENDLFLRPEIGVNYPRSASLGGFVFRKHEDQIAQLGVIIPDVTVPEGNDPTSSQWATSIRIADREISAENLAEAVVQPLGQDIVLVLPTQSEPLPAKARILWFALNENGSFVVERN